MYLNRDSTVWLGFCKANQTNDGKAESHSIKFRLTCHRGPSCLSQHSAPCLAHLSCLVTPLVGSARCLSPCTFVQALPFTWSCAVRVSVPSSEVLFLCAAHFRAQGPHLSSLSLNPEHFSVFAPLYFIQTEVLSSFIRQG